MAKITRKTALIFGISAGINQIAEFGSLAAGTPVFTTDPAVIQSLSNYLGGWFNAVVGGNSPAIEDMNALCYLFAYQIAYGMQAGIPEWDAGTTYYINSLVQSGGVIYMSRTDTNLNNAVTSAANWGGFGQPGVITPLAASGSFTVATGNCLQWPYLTVPTGAACIIQTGAYFLGKGFLTLGGTATLTVQGTGVVTI